VSDSELNAAINLAYSTAGMEKNALDIPCGLPAGSYHTIHHDAYSQCQLWDIIYLTHPFYCTLETPQCKYRLMTSSRLDKSNQKRRDMI
jgi:hypothetical protein